MESSTTEDFHTRGPFFRLPLYSALGTHRYNHYQYSLGFPRVPSCEKLLVVGLGWRDYSLPNLYGTCAGVQSLIWGWEVQVLGLGFSKKALQ